MRTPSRAGPGNAERRFRSPVGRVFSTAFFSVWLASCGGGGDSGGSESPIPAAPEPGIIGDGRLPELVEWTRSSRSLPAVAAVFVQHGQIIEQTVAGRRSLSHDTLATTADRWHLGSLTKAMTATLTGVLVEQSMIDWETTPLEVWPELAGNVHPSFREITLRQLLSHTSGMVRDPVQPELGDSAPGTPMEKRRLGAARLLAEAPAGPAGQYLYSNAGYVVAGAMLETRTATPWETLLAQQVFAPLGMTESGFGAPSTPGQSDQPWGHWDRGSRFEAVAPGPGADNPQAIGPAGTVHSTLGDYSRFMVAHIAGARGVPGLVSVSTFATLHAPVSEVYALGWGIAPDLSDVDSAALTHAGSNLRWYAEVWIAPGHDAGAIFVTNAGGPRAEAAIDALNDLYRSRFAASQ